MKTILFSILILRAFILQASDLPNPDNDVIKLTQVCLKMTVDVDLRPTRRMSVTSFKTLDGNKMKYYEMSDSQVFASTIVQYINQKPILLHLSGQSLRGSFSIAGPLHEGVKGCELYIQNESEL
jgi:hypothetical protein